MAIFIAVGFVVVGCIEITLWPKRTFKKVAVYLFLLVLMAAFSVAVTLNIDLPVPSPLDWLSGLFGKLIKGMEAK